MTDKLFPKVVGPIVAIIFVLYCIAVRYNDAVAVDAANNGIQVARFQTSFFNVSIMIYIGFGFLMTFPRRYSFSAVGFNFILATVAFLWNVLCAGFWENVHSDSHDGGDFIQLSMPLFMEGLFGAGAVLISMGAVLGRTTASQLIVMGFLEIIFYSFNFYIGALELKATDSGGSMFVHTWGAYFGLAVSIAMTKFGPRSSSVVHQADIPGPRTSDPALSRTTSDITAMLGTLFLWIMWPSFNGALAGDGDQLRVIFNTVISLCGATFAAYLASHLFEGRFDMVHIQNATLAGGVAIGTGANLFTQPAGALFIGFFAGAISVLGYVKFTDKLATLVGMRDTCGVHNLHGMPGVIGGISGIILAATYDESDYGTLDPFTFSKGKQQSRQFLALLITLAMAIVSGLLVGFILSKMPPLSPKDCFEDDHAWNVCEDYTSVGAHNPMAGSRAGTRAPTIVSPSRRQSVTGSIGGDAVPTADKAFESNPLHV